MGRNVVEENSESPTLEVRGLVVSRPGGFVLRVDALRLGRGDAVAIVGPSGVGKSSLLAAVTGHVRPGDPLTWVGEVSLHSAPWPRPGTAAWRAALRGPVCTIGQDTRAAFDPLRPLGAQAGDLAGTGADDVLAALGRLGVEDAATVAGRLPHQVSGGQAQRALLAVALLRGASLCLLDEPSAGLDGPRVAQLVRALDALRDRAALLVATHDRGLVAALRARAVRIEAGALVEGQAEDAPWPAVAPADAEAPVVAACEGLGVRVGRTWLVERCDLVLRRGENVALVGPSGAGKTTVGRALAGLVRPARGGVVRPGRAGAVQMLFQDAAGSLTPSRSVRSLVEEAAVAGFDIAAEARALGLGPDLLERSARALSGGEQRRAALLRALSVRPEVLVLDEPTAALDRAAALRVVETLLGIRARTGAAMLWITHDDALARAVADRIVTIRGGTT